MPKQHDRARRKASPRRHRQTLYLSDEMTRQLRAAAEAHRLSKSAILERALQQFLSGSTREATSGLQSLQHDQTLRTLRRLERDLAIVSELTATFVRYFLTITPPLPSREHAAARALGTLRFDQVIDEIAKCLRTDRSLMARVMATVVDGADRTAANASEQGETDAASASQPVSADPRNDG